MLGSQMKIILSQNFNRYKLSHGEKYVFHLNQHKIVNFLPTNLKGNKEMNQFSLFFFF